MAAYMSTGFRTRLLGTSSFAGIFQYGSIEIRAGAQPADADQAALGTLLARITRDGGAWSAGSSTNGLEFEQSGQYVLKAAAHTWQLTGIATGTAGWFRLVGNAADAGGLSTSAVRLDGACGLLAAEGDIQLYLPTLSISPSTTIMIPSWWFALPPLS